MSPKDVCKPGGLAVEYCIEFLSLLLIRYVKSLLYFVTFSQRITWFILSWKGRFMSDNADLRGSQEATAWVAARFHWLIYVFPFFLECCRLTYFSPIHPTSSRYLWHTPYLSGTVTLQIHSNLLITQTKPLFILYYMYTSSLTDYAHNSPLAPFYDMVEESLHLFFLLLSHETEHNHFILRHAGRSIEATLCPATKRDINILLKTSMKGSFFHKSFSWSLSNATNVLYLVFAFQNWRTFLTLIKLKMAKSYFKKVAFIVGISRSSGLHDWIRSVVPISVLGLDGGEYIKSWILFPNNVRGRKK